MALFVIADLHLSIGGDKPMDDFPGWEDYVKKLEENWKSVVKDEDTVVLPGDISWGMELEESERDFEFLHKLPGRKLILKGNHDYWFSTKKKTEDFWIEKGFYSLKMLFNNAFFYKELALCGSRGWINETGETPDARILKREAGRLRLSLDGAKGKEAWVFLHYPPVFNKDICVEIMDVLKEFSVKKVYYGHLHGGLPHSFAVKGERDGIDYTLVSADYLNFMPLKIAE